MCPLDGKYSSIRYPYPTSLTNMGVCRNGCVISHYLLYRTDRLSFYPEDYMDDNLILCWEILVTHKYYLKTI